MTQTRTATAWQPQSAVDFKGVWRCFDDSNGPCPAIAKSGRITIQPPAVDPDVKAIIDFADLSGFPAIAHTADFRNGALEVLISGNRFRITPCGTKGRRRVLHGKGDPGTAPGSWTAEEEDGAPEPPDTDREYNPA